jgi:hypothetical protein
MKRYLIVIILVCFVLQISDAQTWKQKRFEAMAGVGTTQFFGDIGGFSKKENILGLKDISFSQTRFNVNVSAKYRILKELNVRLNMVYGMMHATDSRGSNELRGYEARISVYEPSAMAEYYFIKSKLGDSYLFNQGKSTGNASILSAIEFYAFGGVGGLIYTVKGNDLLVARGLKSRGVTAVIPAGLGINILIAPQYNVGAEFGGRYSFSDYLDGYTAQQSSSKDVYYLLNVTFTYKFKTTSEGWPLFLSKKRF